jgi:archaellum biogenesis protein FlaJ (TadC family)
VTWLPMEWGRHATAAGSNVPGSDISPRMRLAGAALRMTFIAVLVVATLRVSMPQNETIWTAYDTPGDLVRLALGLAVSVWLVFQLFKAPRDARGYQTWLYFGLVAVPFSLICLVAIW